MGKQWARQEAKRNEIATAVEKATLWVRFHPQTALWSALGLIAVAFVGVAFASRVHGEREASWGKFAIAQAYAYSRQPQGALDQAKQLADEYPGSTAASYGWLLAGDILFEQKQYAQALAAFQQVVDRPNHPEVLPLALADLGLVQEASGDCSAAAGTSQRFLDTYAEHFLAPQMHASLARCHSALGRADQARAAYERMSFLYPGSYWAEWAKDRLKG